MHLLVTEFVHVLLPSTILLVFPPNDDDYRGIAFLLVQHLYKAFPVFRQT